MRRILFLNNHNGFEHKDPTADLIEVDDNINERILHALELLQPGVGRVGGSWKKIMEDGLLAWRFVNSGKQSDFKERDYDQIYKLISGNY